MKEARQDYTRCALAFALLAAGCGSAGDSGAGGAGSTAPPPAPIACSFDDGAEGWALHGFDTDADDYSISTSTSEAAAVDATGGESGGALHRTETYYGWTDYFEAPPKLLGDLSGYYGGSLDFALRCSTIESPFPAPLVLLASGGSMWRYDGGPSAQTTWVSFSVPLTTSGWSRVADRVPPTEAELRQGLAAVSGLWIRGEFSSNIDDSWLDDVVIGF